MGWKNWPAWLKGGVIGFLIAVAIWLILFISAGNKLGAVIFFLSFFIIGIIFCGYNIDTTNMPSGGFCSAGGMAVAFVILHLILFLVLGALIGLIIGKIKSRGKK